MRIGEVDICDKVKVWAGEDAFVIVPDQHTCGAGLSTSDLADSVAIVHRQQMRGERKQLVEEEKLAARSHLKVVPGRWLRLKPVRRQVVG